MCTFNIADIEIIFEAHVNKLVKQLILISVRDVFYFERRTCQEKRCLLKYLDITRLHEITTKDVNYFDQRWNVFIEASRLDNNIEIVGISCRCERVKFVIT